MRKVQVSRLVYVCRNKHSSDSCINQKRRSSAREWSWSLFSSSLLDEPQISASQSDFLIFPLIRACLRPEKCRLVDNELVSATSQASGTFWGLVANNNKSLASITSEISTVPPCECHAAHTIDRKNLFRLCGCARRRQEKWKFSVDPTHTSIPDDSPSWSLCGTWQEFKFQATLPGWPRTPRKTFAKVQNNIRCAHPRLY